VFAAGPDEGVEDDPDQYDDHGLVHRRVPGGGGLTVPDMQSTGVALTRLPTGSDVPYLGVRM
jgi:hypothetical protein